MNLPRISAVIATFNSDRTLDRCLKSLRNQTYPQEKIQLIMADGGSSDNTIKIGKKYRAKIILVPKDKQGAEYNKAYGLQYATGEYILCIDHDNILPHNKWLINMLQPHLTHTEIVATQPLRYHYDKSFSLLDRYFALFGVNDPLAYYLGKADRMDYIHDTYNLLGRARDMGHYYIVTFDKNNPQKIPTLGANGFLIKSKHFKKSQHSLGKYYHIDINVDLVKQGLNTYAFIKDDIIHLTNSRFFNFLKRRKHFMEEYYMKSLALRRYSVYRREDLSKLVLFVIYTVTFIRPFLDSLRGIVRVRDKAWLVHPFMCIAIVYIYSTAAIKGFMKKYV